jgi:hypothetical protein
MNTIEGEKADETVRVCYPYFHKPDPIRFKTETTYSDNQTTLAVTDSHERLQTQRVALGEQPWSLKNESTRSSMRPSCC